MKGLISEWGGTRQGVLYALTSLGYDKSYIEPFSVQDPERWAEFIIFLKSSKQSGVYNLDVIDFDALAKCFYIISGKSELVGKEVTFIIENNGDHVCCSRPLL